ncbi:MAG: hydrogenase nickel incorporation protein HypB [Armatimonadetes bacterium]|nr:hydrogenase nickel incorporation protein HypB [Candidatus Hippobium faecium]
MKIDVMKNISANNDIFAEKNRKFCKENNIRLINVMASPGAGKTSVIKQIVSLNPKKYGVIEGDIASAIDAEKFEKMGVGIVQINTGGGCHLTAHSVGEALRDLNFTDGTVFVENVGNLVCPSAFDLGENVKLLISSVPEGSDKPFKYISMFECADIVVINKWDLCPYIDFDYDEFERGVRAINQEAPIIKVCCRDGLGIDELKLKINI